MRSDLLHDANPYWLGRLRFGVTLLLVVTPLILCSRLVIRVGLFSLPNIAYYVIPLLTSTLLISGCWLISEPELSHRDEKDGGDNRWRLRAVTVFYGFFFVIALTTRLIPRLRIPTVSLVFTPIDALIFVCGAYLLFKHLVILAKRSPDRLSTRIGRWLLYGYVPILAVVKLANTIIIFDWNLNQRRPVAANWLVASNLLISCVVGLIAAFLMVLLLVRMNRNLRRAHQIACTNWSTVTSQSPPSDSHIHPS